MAHIVNQEAEAILDKEYQVHNYGFVRLVDYLGGDARIVQSARVSYGAGTKTVREDKGLINYLIRNSHMSPFEQVIFTFHVKMPIFVARQWVRHRTARLNEISGRYSVLKDEFYLPPEEAVRYQSKTNKQGSSLESVAPEVQRQVVALLRQSCASACTAYHELIDQDIARELARINLPLSLYTEMYWQIDLRNLFNFIQLRLDTHAQAEIRAYAKVIADIVRLVTPLAWEAFEEHVLYAKRMSRSQVQKIAAALAQTRPELLEELGMAYDA